MMVIIQLFNSCIRSFVPDVSKYAELVVVDGGVHDGPGPYVIKLSKSSPLKERSKYNPLTGCQVQIQDNANNKVYLTEKEPGVYKTDSTAMQGMPGRGYKLIISTPEGEQIESDEEVLKKGLKIQSVYGELEHKTDPHFFYGRDGYQFYVDAENPGTDDNYLLWRMQSTYKFRADFPIRCYYDNGVHYVLDGDSLRTCYRTTDILNLFLLNTQELTQKEIKHFPINYEDNYTKALTIRYSLKVSMFTMNEAAFNYWSTIKKIVDSGGELFSQQPFQVPNNLKNNSHPEKPVLGYFMVAGLSEKRIFVNKPPIIDRTDKCFIGNIQINPLMWFVSRPDIWPVFYADNGSGGAYYLDPECVDCRTTGTLTKPAFWQE